MEQKVIIDGSFGEGGGQILRTALCLSIMTGKPLEIFNIRASRSKPGLAHQHLSCIKLCEQISNATIDGARLRSQKLNFQPEKTQSGSYSLGVGTAGSVSLVLHSIFLPLSFAETESTVTIEGGTHVPWSPSFNYLADQWLRYMRKIGLRIDLTLKKAGYFPRGGGIITAKIQPIKEIEPLNLIDRGELKKIKVTVYISNLDRQIAEREMNTARKLLKSEGYSIDGEIVEYNSIGQGTGTHIHIKFGNGSASFTSLGQIGIRAEAVAKDCVQEAIDFINSEAAIDRYLADQLILPLYFAHQSSSFTTNFISEHLLTNAAIVKKFLPIDIRIEGEKNKPGKISIHPR